MSEEFASAADTAEEKELARREIQIRHRIIAREQYSPLGRHARQRGVLAGPGVGPRYVIFGEIDGLSFTVEHGCGRYTVIIEPSISPAADLPDAVREYRDDQIIAFGPVDDLRSGPYDLFLDSCVTLDVAIDAVRTYVLRVRCEHETPGSPDHRYCGRCGTRITAPGKSATMVRVAR